jgi:hypothetical protein
VAARIDAWHVIPDAAVMTVVFLGLRREPLPLALTALLLGHLVGRQALAPFGLHETALTACAVSVYLASGNLRGGGPVYFAIVSGVACGGYHLLLFLLALASGHAGFSSWATAALVPSALATGLLALVSYPWMWRLERRLSPEKREGLAWR